MHTLSKTNLFIPPKQVFSIRSDIFVHNNSIFIYGKSEERSQVEEAWLTKFAFTDIHEIIHTEDIFTAIIPSIGCQKIPLRDQNLIRRWLASFQGRTIFLDITGLAHHVWMPLLRVALNNDFDIKCIYTEPAAYRLNKNPRPGEFYDLSEEIRGLNPIPTFSRIPSRRQQPSPLVVSLGFEGVRFKYIVEKIEPNERDLIPIIGVPGFEITYPFESYEGNASVLSASRAWQRLEYVDASCPFSMLMALEGIKARYPGRGMQLATIGTKPHALGSMLFALSNSDCELIFDHPKKKQSRTAGSSRIHMYDLASYRVSTFG